MKKIVDCFMYFNEKELLELRVNLLKDHVDAFIICETNCTHSGKRKEFTCRKVAEEVGLPLEKLIIIEYDVMSEESLKVDEIDEINAKSSGSSKEVKAWTRERLQRDAMLSVVDKFFDDEYVFIVSDCDEIINPRYIKYFSDVVRKEKNAVIKIPLVLLEGRANMRVHDELNNPVWWGNSMFMATKEHFKKATPTIIRSNVNNPFPIAWITEKDNIIQDCGWHFTWMGDENRRKTKAESFIHYANMDSVNTLSSESMKQINNKTNKYHLEKYPISKLPSQILELSRVKEFLLKDTKFINLIK
jgi:beta-1,4-mannosyl-glycoprotein beta-1,4-N-acetylglucosaminyltransferase